MHRGLAQSKLSHNKKALKDYTAALSLDRYYMEAYLQRGILLLEMNDIEGAFRNLKIVIKYEPKNPNAYYYHALCNLYEGLYSAAKKDLNKVIEIDPQNKNAYFKRGVAYYDSGSKKKACADWNTALQLGHKSAAPTIDKYCH